MTVSADTDRNVIQALAHVARLGEYTLVSVATSDDAQKRVLTIKFSGISSGFVQDYLPYDTETTPLIAHVNGHGEVEKIEGMSPAEIDATLQPGDLAETDAQAEEAIARAEEIAAGEVLAEISAEQLTQAPGVSDLDPDEQTRSTDAPFVGELAAASKQNRRK